MDSGTHKTAQRVRGQCCFAPFRAGFSVVFAVRRAVFHFAPSPAGLALAGQSKYNKYGPIYFTWIGGYIAPRPRPPCSGLRPAPRSSRFGSSAPFPGRNTRRPGKAADGSVTPDRPPLHAAFAAYAATRRKWTLQWHIFAPAVCVPHIFLFPFLIDVYIYKNHYILISLRPPSRGMDNRKRLPTPRLCSAYFFVPILIYVYMYPHNIVYTQTSVRKLIFRIHYGIILMFMVPAPMNTRKNELFSYLII